MARMQQGSGEDDRLGFICRCVDCGNEEMQTEGPETTCTACRRVYAVDEAGIIHAMPSTARTLPEGIYRSPEYLAWLEAWKQESQNWVIYSNPLYRFFSMSGHRRIAKWLRREYAGGAIVVDVGCGTGKLFDLVPAQLGIGVDANLDSLAEMKRHCPEVVAVHGDALNLPFRTGSLPLAVSLHTLEHVYFLAEALEEARRILCEGGKFLFTIPTEGGVAWELGRRLVTGPRLRRRYGLSVKKVMDVEHINDAKRVLKLVDFYFDRERMSYFPFALPWLNVNASISGMSIPKNSDTSRLMLKRLVPCVSDPTR